MSEPAPSASGSTTEPPKLIALEGGRFRIPEGCVALYGTVQTLNDLGLGQTKMLTDGKVGFALFRLPEGIDADGVAVRMTGMKVYGPGSVIPY